MKLFPDNIRCVSVIAPASRTPFEKLRPFLTLLKSEGVRVKIAPHAFAFDDAGYLAATAEERAADFQAASCDSEVDAVIPLRGGFGCAHLPELVDFSRLPAKPVFGYSDLTCLHLSLLKYGKMIPIAAPMAGKLPHLLCDCAEAVRNRRAFALALTPPERGGEELAIPCHMGFPGTARGKATPCNLTVLASLCGTGLLPDFRGRILVLEDIGEPVYKLDRMLTQLRLCGILSAVSGVIFGEFLDCGAPAGRNALLRRFADRLGKPCLLDFPFGHGDNLVSLNFLRNLRMEADGTAVLE